MAKIDKRVHTLNNVFDRLDSILGVLKGRKDETNGEAIKVLETIIENASTVSYQEALVRLDDEGLKEYYTNVIEFVLVLAKKVGIPESSLMEGLNDPVNSADLWKVSGFKEIARQDGSGVVYPTLDATAHAFGMANNAYSISENKEIFATIYKKGDGYTYFNTVIIEAHGGFAKYGTNVKAFVHTHGAYDYPENEDKFSDTDIAEAKRVGVPSYLISPTGVWGVYDPHINEAFLLGTDMPYDPILDK